jgi:hypothetical protein
LDASLEHDFLGESISAGQAGTLFRAGSASVLALFAEGIVDDEHLRVLLNVGDLVLKSVDLEVSRLAILDT